MVKGLGAVDWLLIHLGRKRHGHEDERDHEMEQWVGHKKLVIGIGGNLGLNWYLTQTSTNPPFTAENRSFYGPVSR